VLRADGGAGLRRPFMAWLKLDIRYVTASPAADADVYYFLVRLVRTRARPTARRLGYELFGVRRVPSAKAQSPRGKSMFIH